MRNRGGSHPAGDPRLKQRIKQVPPPPPPPGRARLGRGRRGWSPGSAAKPSGAAGGGGEGGGAGSRSESTAIATCRTVSGLSLWGKLCRLVFARLASGWMD